MRLAHSRTGNILVDGLEEIGRYDRMYQWFSDNRTQLTAWGVSRVTLKAFDEVIATWGREQRDASSGFFFNADSRVYYPGRARVAALLDELYVTSPNDQHTAASVPYILGNLHLAAALITYSRWDSLGSAPYLTFAAAVLQVPTEEIPDVRDNPEEEDTDDPASGSAGNGDSVSAAVPAPEPDAADTADAA